MYRPQFLNFKVDQINVMANQEVVYILIKTKFLGFRNNESKFDGNQKRSGCKKYK